MTTWYRSIGIAWLCCVAHGQPAATPVAFEVASVKPADPAQPMAVKRSGNHLSTSNTSLEWLITWAYDVHTDRLYGVPKWADSDRYDIVANAPEEVLGVERQPGELSPLQRMMQALLAERFNLSTHRESRELSVYSLVVAKGGPKVVLGEASGSMNQNPFRMAGRGRLIGTGVSAAMLAKVLSDQIGRTVLDDTGLKGIFDFTLEWEPDLQPGGEESAPGGTSIFTALQQQLGFRLEARKGPVDVIVIDHVERAAAAN